jgi:superfamily II DNA or RNA helicase
MARDPFERQLDHGRKDRDLEGQFKSERIDDRGYAKSQHPAAVDRAAVDVVKGIALGQTTTDNDAAATIGSQNFPQATGDIYQEGLASLVGGKSGAVSAIDQFDAEDLSLFGYRIAEFRDDLREVEPSVDLDRGIEALVEKLSTDAMRDNNSISMSGLGGKLKHRNSASDLLVQLLSDPDIREFGTELFELVNEHAESDSLTHLLDSPKMTTILWEHQRTALREWVEAGSQGYVDMATATGKTVLGLAAIALRYGELHPHDQDLVVGNRELASVQSGSADPEVLIVAGNKLLLTQWHREFDEHLDIPSERTEPEESGSSYRVALNWGGTAKIDFRSAQSLASQGHVGGYDLVILDEAHQYSQSGRGQQRWGDVYEQLVSESNAVLAMSGSVQTGWEGDASARRALEKHLDLCFRYTLEEARKKGVIADFEWNVRYVPTTEGSAEKLATQTEPIKPYLDLGEGVLDTQKLGIEIPDRDNDFPSLDTVRAFVRTNDGKKLQNKSKRFDTLSSALLSRRTVGWNLSVRYDSIAEVVAENETRKTVVLIQSYEQTIKVKEAIVARLDSTPPIFALEGREGNIDRKVQNFNEGDSGVLIGPGKLLGTGVDLPDAEVAVNLATGNVTATLIQRIGRVLRNPSGQKEASFYHLVPRTTPENTIMPREDGYRHLVQMADFAQLGESIAKQPEFERGTASVGKTVTALREIGADHLEAFPRLYGDASGPEAQEILEERAAGIRAGIRSDHSDYMLSQADKARGEFSSPEEMEDHTSIKENELSDADRAELEMLERVVMNSTSSSQAQEIRLNAITRLTEFGAPGRKMLDNIAHGNEGIDEVAKKIAREQLRSIAE